MKKPTCGGLGWPIHRWEQYQFAYHVRGMLSTGKLMSSDRVYRNVEGSRPPKSEGARRKKHRKIAEWFCAVREGKSLIALNRGALPLGTTSQIRH